MVAMKDPNAVGQWNRTIPFPTDRYLVRCIEEEFSESSSGNPMIVRTFELVQQAPIKVGDKQYDVDGQKITQYRVVKNADGQGGWDAEKTSKSQETLREELTKVGYTEESFDDENPPLIFKGKVFDAVVSGQKKTMYKAPTPEQVAKGHRVGDPIKGPDGKDTFTYQLNIDLIYGISTAEVNRPY